MRLARLAGVSTFVGSLTGGGSFLSQETKTAEFGLGPCAGPVDVEVFWPSGVVDVVTVAPNQRITVVESNPTQTR